MSAEPCNCPGCKRGRQRGEALEVLPEKQNSAEVRPGVDVMIGAAARGMCTADDQRHLRLEARNGWPCQSHLDLAWNAVEAILALDQDWLHRAFDAGYSAGYERGASDADVGPGEVPADEEAAWAEWLALTGGSEPNAGKPTDGNANKGQRGETS